MDEAEFDQVAEDYYAQHKANITASGESPEYFAEYKIIDLAKEISDRAMTCKTVMDFGSGIGNSIPHIRKHLPDASLVCADVSSKSLEIAQKRFPGAEQHSHIKDNKLGFEDGHFDAVFSACVFHHIDHDEHNHWLTELARVTKPGGILLIYEHNPLNPLTMKAVNTCPFDVNAKLIKAGEFKARITKAGWQKAQARYRIFFPRQLASLRKFERSMMAIPLGAQYYVCAQKGALDED